MITTQWLITSLDYSVSRDVVILHVQVTEPFSFLEGQFMMLQTLIGDKIIKRAYSIYSTNNQLQNSQIISFCIKRKEWWVFSTWATQVAKEGMQITMVWPLWKFIDTGVSKNYLFISVGSGLSPCFSLYTSLLQTGNYDKIVNLFGERYLDHIPAEVLEQYSLQNEKVYNQICLSKEESLWDGMISGYVQDGLDSALRFLNTQDVTVFICWLPTMCDDVAQILQDKGIEKQRLIIEKY